MDIEELDKRARINLKAARIASGKHPDQLCRYTSNSPSSYYDVEEHDFELCNTLDLEDVRGLCADVGITVRNLFGSHSHSPLLEPESIVQKIQEHLSANNLTLSDFEDDIGYYLSAAIKNPQSVWKDWNIDCLRNVCAALQLNWLDVFE